MSKHTPGPWKVFQTKGEPPFYIIGIGRENGEGIADANTGLGIWDADSPEAFANAHLIAAAPDLLQALKDYRAALMMGPLEIAAKFGPDFNPDDIVIEADKKAAAAIAKAEGLNEVGEQGIAEGDDTIIHQENTNG